MPAAPIPANEAERLAGLLRYDVLDSEFEAAYDDLTEMASVLCGTPISLISLIDSGRQWFKSQVGLEARESTRESAFCAHAILQEEVFVVEDALKDERFADNPFVTSEPHIRFYAGAPLRTPDGHVLGTLCVIDRVPRQFDAEQRRVLRVLANQVISQLELRLANRRLQQSAALMLEANAAKDKFFYIIAHDLRGPFNTMMGFSRLLVDSLDAPELSDSKEMAEDIGESCSNTLKLLDNLLEWAMGQAGKDDFRPSRIGLDDLIGEVTSLLSTMAKTKAIRISWDGAEGSEVHCDRYMMFSVLQNLLHNAIKFTPREGAVRLFVDHQETEAVISVSDTGIGMSGEQLEALFRLEETRSTPGTEGEEGTGLGLALCKQFVERNGGRLEVASREGEGTTFRVVLPLSSPEPASRTESPNSKNDQPADPTQFPSRAQRL